MVKKLSLLFCLLFLTTYLVHAETIKVPNEGIYVGDVKNGKPHGQGTLNNEDGETYVGSWKEGLKDGIGTLTYIDGSKYAGAFKDNKIHGY